MCIWQFVSPLHTVRLYDVTPDELHLGVIITLHLFNIINDPFASVMLRKKKTSLNNLDYVN